MHGCPGRQRWQGWKKNEGWCGACGEGEEVNPRSYEVNPTQDIKITWLHLFCKAIFVIDFGL